MNQKKVFFGGGVKKRSRNYNVSVGSGSDPTEREKMVLHHSEGRL